MPSPVYVSLFLAFSAAVLLLFGECYCVVFEFGVLMSASISPPAWEQVNFLKANAGGVQTIYGVFGQCIRGGSCSSRSVGYDLTVGGLK